MGADWEWVTETHLYRERELIANTLGSQDVSLAKTESLRFPPCVHANDKMTIIINY